MAFLEQFLFSEQVDNSAWTKSHLSVSADSVVSPIATLTADLVVEDAVASVQHFFTPATSPVILPGNSAQSKLVIKQSQGNHHGQLSPAELTRVKEWIRWGAPESAMLFSLCAKMIEATRKRPRSHNSGSYQIWRPFSRASTSR